MTPPRNGPTTATETPSVIVARSSDAEAEPSRPSRRRWLGPLLLAGDQLALAASVVALPELTPAAVVAHLLVGEIAIRSLRLRLTRIASVWATETVGMLRVALLLGVLSLVVSRSGLAGIPRAAVVTAVTTGLLWSVRAAYRAGVARLRRAGRGMTDIAVIGTPAGVDRLLADIDDRPETGFRVRGVFGPADLWSDARRPWLGDESDAAEVMAELGIRHALLDTSLTTGSEATRLIRQLAEVDVDVQVSTGLHDLDHRQVTLRPMGRIPVLFVEAAGPSAIQRLAKRSLDVVGATLGLLVLSPVLAVMAALIKLEDGGPVLYRQDRVGRDGHLFPMMKLRSMRPNADREVGALQADNVRTGPLFKVANDPRVTRIGRFIRASSIDEIPQFLNVLRGEMSLIGPRPALPSEVAEFDEELGRRHRVCPGLTGLWQVEAREEADFEHYRRLDLYYVHNYSFLLDVTILLITPVAVLRRARSAIGARTSGLRTTQPV